MLIKSARSKTLVLRQPSIHRIQPRGKEKFMFRQYSFSAYVSICNKSSGERALLNFNDRIIARNYDAFSFREQYEAENIKYVARLHVTLV